MALVSISLSQGTLWAVVAYGLYWVYWEFTIGATHRRMIKEHGCKPPKKLPQMDPILGLDLLYSSLRALKRHTFMEETKGRFDKMGNTFQSNMVGRKAILTIEPENLKTMLSLKFKDFGLGPSRLEFAPLLGAGIFTTDGAAWQHSRDLIRPNFVRSQVGDLDTFERHVSHLIQAIPRDGSTVNLQDLFFRLTIDSATEFLFGESTNCLAPGTSTESSTAFAEAFNRSQEAIGNHTRMGIFAILPDPEFKKDCKIVHDFADLYVNRALEYRKTHYIEKADLQPGDRYVFLNELVKGTTDPVQIRSELLNVLLAGRDTTASLLSNIWWTLSKRPDVWAKLRAEVDALGGEAPTYAQIKDMKYLRFVMNECESLQKRGRKHRKPSNLTALALRIHPVVPGNARMALKDTVVPLGGGPDGKSPVFIPKGWTLAWSVWTMHRRKDLFGEDAEEFKPERWETLRPGWEYLPFNGGPRICIGRQ